MRFTDGSGLSYIGPLKSWSLLLDLDGSLADMALDPDPIVMPARLSLPLLCLKARLGGALAILSSRIRVAGTDGILCPEASDVPRHQEAELFLGKSRFIFQPVQSDLLAHAVLKLERLTQMHSACSIESRADGIAFHWGLAPHLETVVMDHILELASELGSAFRFQRGECVVEIVATETVKARAVSSLMGHVPYKGRAPILIGENLADESILRLVQALGGFSIQVGSGHSKADYSIENKTSLQKWLAGWGQAERSRRAGEINLHELR